jgi:plastocyanin
MPAGVGSNMQLTFSPATITVVIGVNNTIVWTSNDTSVHNVDFQSGPAGATLPPVSVNVKQGQSTSPVTLTTAGTYTYVCDYHAWMKGTINVEAAGSTMTTTSSSSTTQTTSQTTSTSSSSTTQTTTSSSTGSSTTIVTMPSGVGANMTATFSPATITVVVGVNNTIVWTNDDTAVHNVDFQTGPSGATLPSTSVNVRNGQSTPAITLTVPGTYTYVCDYHAWMKGTIVVVAA